MRTTKAALVVLALLTLGLGQVACSQARCAWQKACTTYEKSCEPCPGPPVVVDPVYDVGCGTGQATTGRGAFAVPRQP